MTTDLHDLMHEAVRDAHPDLTALTERSRKHGLGIRRRRQALSTLGAAALVSAVALGSVQLTQGPATPPAAASPSASPSASSSTQVPMTGPAVASALTQAVRDAVGPFAGGFSEFRGQASEYEAYADLRYQPQDRGGYSLIGINVQPDFDETEIYRCRDWQVKCTVTKQKDGGTLMTYEEHTQSPEGLGIRSVTDLMRPDGVRVVASSANGESLAGGHWKVTRQRPALSLTQLYLVVTEPWWGPTLDDRFEVGRDSDLYPYPYTDLDADRGDWVRVPTPAP